MSDQETRQIARQWFDALDRGDIETALSCLADDVEWFNLPKIPGVSDIVPWLGTCHGVAEVAESFRIRDEVVEVKVFKPLDLVVQGEQAVGTVRDYALVKSTGQFFDIEFASWFQVRGVRSSNGNPTVTLLPSLPPSAAIFRRACSTPCSMMTSGPRHASSSRALTRIPGRPAPG